MKSYGLTAAMVGIAALLGAGAASAATINAGKWKVTIDGNINANFVYTECADKTGPAGNLLCSGRSSKALGDKDVAGVSTGLLPSALVIGVSTTQAGYDIGATVGFYPGITVTPSPNFGSAFANQPSGIALGTASIDVRQAFMTFGNDQMGKFLFGRNYGLFGFDVIVNDMTLQGVGVSGFAAPTPNNTTLGSIGFGYIYTDELAQIDYTTPSMHGLTATVGVFEPLNEFNFSGLSAGSTGSGKHTTGIQAKIKYQYKGDQLSGFLSTSGLYQRQTGLVNPMGNLVSTPDFSSYGADITGKIALGPLALLGSVYYTKGLGTTALFFDGADRFGKRRTSFGYFAQATYTVGNTMFGVNYGKSRLLQTDREEGISQGLIFDHSKITAGIYHHLTKSLIILAEATRAFASADNPALNINETNFDVGAFFKF